MPVIDFKLIQDQFKTNDAELPFNLVLVQHVPGKAPEPMTPRPELISSMVDVAIKAEPGFKVSLNDENRRPVTCSVDYYENVNSKEDLAVHLSPDWVHSHMTEDQEHLNVQQRLKARQAALEGLRNLLRQRPELAQDIGELIKTLRAERDRLFRTIS